MALKLIVINQKNTETLETPQTLQRFEENTKPAPRLETPLFNQTTEIPLTLIIARRWQVSIPIDIAPGVKVVDSRKFIDSAVGDLMAYVAATNRGSGHWAEDLAEEKLEQLELCGVKAELRRIH